MMQLPLLSLVIWLPVVRAGLILLTADDAHPSRARVIALVTTLVCAALCVPMYTHFNFNTSAWQFRETLSWIPSYNIHYDVGVDGISLPLIFLTVYTTLLVVLAAWRTITNKVAQYMATFLIMQGMVIGVFSSLDALYSIVYE